MTRFNGTTIRQRQRPHSSRLLLHRGSINNALPQDELDARLPDDLPNTALEVVRQRLSGQKALPRMYQRDMQLGIEQLDFRRHFRSHGACSALISLI